MEIEELMKFAFVVQHLVGFAWMDQSEKLCWTLRNWMIDHLHRELLIRNIQKTDSLPNLDVYKKNKLN